MVKLVRVGHIVCFKVNRVSSGKTRNVAAERGLFSILLSLFSKRATHSNTPPCIRTPDPCLKAYT